MTDDVPSSLMACIIFSMWLRQTSGRMVLCLVHVVTVRIRRITLPQEPFTSTCCRHGFMPGYNCWTKHGERGVIMEDNEEEEDNDNYPMFTEHGDTDNGGRRS